MPGAVSGAVHRLADAVRQADAKGLALEAVAQAVFSARRSARATGLCTKPANGCSRPNA